VVDSKPEERNGSLLVFDDATTGTYTTLYIRGSRVAAVQEEKIPTDFLGKDEGGEKPSLPATQVRAASQAPKRRQSTKKWAAHNQAERQYRERWILQFELLFKVLPQSDSDDIRLYSGRNLLHICR
jgi:hypothetical protein